MGLEMIKRWSQIPQTKSIRYVINYTVKIQGSFTLGKVLSAKLPPTEAILALAPWIVMTNICLYLLSNAQGAKVSSNHYKNDATQQKDPEHDDLQHNDTQHKGLIVDTHHKNSQHKRLIRDDQQK
jgi:hypothetical protein